MQLSVLATGSKGNASIVSGENESIAIDFGLSYKKWVGLLEKNNLMFPDELFITHSHGDHANESGLSRLIKLHDNIYIHTNRGDFETEEFLVHTFLIPHDVENHGIIVTEKSTGYKLVYITDCFHMYDTMTNKNNYDLVKDADLYALEANYDKRWMENPDYLEQTYYRYNVFNNMSRHTSKQESLKTFAKLKKTGSQYVPLHMSSRFYDFSNGGYNG